MTGDSPTQEKHFDPRHSTAGLRQPASRWPGLLPPRLWSRRGMGACTSLGSRIWSAKATATDPVGVKGRRGSRSPAASPSSGGSSSRNSRNGTSRRCGGMSFRTVLNKSRRTTSGMANTTTAMATVPTAGILPVPVRWLHPDDGARGDDGPSTTLSRSRWCSWRLLLTHHFP